MAGFERQRKYSRVKCQMPLYVLFLPLAWPYEAVDLAAAPEEHAACLRHPMCVCVCVCSSPSLEHRAIRVPLDSSLGSVETHSRGRQAEDTCHGMTHSTTVFLRRHLCSILPGPLSPLAVVNSYACNFVLFFCCIGLAGT